MKTTELQRKIPIIRVLEDARGKEVGFRDYNRMTQLRDTTEGLLAFARAMRQDAYDTALDAKLTAAAGLYEKALSKGDGVTADYAASVLRQALEKRWEFSPNEYGREAEALTRRAEAMDSALSALTMSDKVFEDKASLRREQRRLEELRSDFAQTHDTVEALTREYPEAVAELDGWAPGSREQLSPQAHELNLKKQSLINSYNQLVAFAYRTVFLEAETVTLESTVRTALTLWETRLTDLSEADLENISRILRDEQHYIGDRQQELRKIDEVMESFSAEARAVADSEVQTERDLETERRFRELQEQRKKRAEAQRNGGRTAPQYN